MFVARHAAAKRRAEHHVASAILSCYGRCASTTIPERVDVVVVGGGIVGVSAAMHVAEMGKSVVCLEQNTLTSGTTWHAAGLVTTSGESEAMLKIKEYTRELYKTFVDASGESLVGWSQTGSLMVARDEELWLQTLRVAQLLTHVGIPYQLYCSNTEHPGFDNKVVKPLQEVSSKVHRFLDTTAGNQDSVIGCLHLPLDGIVNPGDVCQAVASRARTAGARIVERCAVSEIVLDADKGTSMRSAAGVRLETGARISCDTVILACGQWTRQLARTAGVYVPASIVPHQYAVFDRIEGVDNSLPVVRDYLGRTYIKPEVGSFAVGSFEAPHKEMPDFVRDRNLGPGPIPRDASNELYDEVPMEKMGDGLEAAMSLVPALCDVGLKSCIHGPDTHSVDHAPIVGFAPGVLNLLVATGFNSQGIQAGAGIGAVLADLAAHGESRTIDEDLSTMDPRRFDPEVSSDARWCDERAREGYSEMYGLHHPNYEYRSGRGKVLSPIHTLLQKKGAVFGPLVNGYERPQYYVRGGKVSDSLFTAEALSFRRDGCAWLEHARFEAAACRTGVALFDMSSFGKLRLSGSDAASALEWCMSSSVPIGDTVQYTQCLNRRGGVESDVTVLRRDPLSGEHSHDEDTFYVVTPSLTVTRDAEHILRESARIGMRDVHIHDVSRDFAVLAVAGPESCALIADLLEGSQAEEVRSGQFAFGTAQTLNFGARINGVSDETMALRVSYAGEMGIELHAKRSDAPAIYKALHQAAAYRKCNNGMGLVNGGYRALMQSLRVEKGFVHFGHDCGPTDTQLESSLGFVSAAKLKNGVPFLGREALVAQKQSGPLRRRLVSFRIESDASATLWGHENVYRDGKRVGYITSGGIGWATNEGRAIGMGFVCSMDGVTKSFLRDGSFTIATTSSDGRAKFVDATATLGALYDPKASRMREGGSILRERDEQQRRASE